MTRLSTKPFDAAKYLTDQDDVVELLNDAFESGEARYIAKALGVAARAEGMSRIAARTEMNRQSLYSTLGENGNPTLDTLLKVMDALGIRLRCEMGNQRSVS